MEGRGVKEFRGNVCPVTRGIIRDIREISAQTLPNLFLKIPTEVDVTTSLEAYSRISRRSPKNVSPLLRRLLLPWSAF